MNDKSIQTEKYNTQVEKENLGDSLIISPFDPKKIDIQSKPATIDQIVARLKYNEIELFSDFQRKNDLWTPEKQSRLIESILIRIPLPAFYFDGTNDNKWLIVDGLQRISTIYNFIVKDVIEVKDEKGKHLPAMKLTNLEFLTDYQDKTFSQLPRDLQRRILETQIQAYIIKHGTPDEVKYNIFKRINTGGLVLEPQEIRNALNQGIPSIFVNELSECKEFKKATDYAIKSNRMEDRDFATRFVSFYLNDFKTYEPDLDTFLNKGMATLRNPKIDFNKIRIDFIKALNTCTTIFGNDAFRKRLNKDDRRKPINKALFEVLTVSISKCDDKLINNLIERKEEVRSKFIELCNDADFWNSITTGTAEKNKVTTRFEKVDMFINSFTI
jgi:hypothetical protein